MDAHYAAESQLSQETLADPTFRFCSSHRCLKTSGVFEHLSAPVRGNGRSFITGVQEALARASRQGIENPVVVGALPFDLTQPSNLYIPQQTTFFNRPPEPVASPVSHTKLAVLTSQNHPGAIRYKQAVQQAIANFRLSDIRKAVVGRVLELELNNTLDADLIFTGLLNQNSAGYHFCVPLTDGGQLVGVSPELLVRKQGQWITSNPLAGSAKRRLNPEEDQATAQRLSHSVKDRYEHRLVIDDIDQVLRPYCAQLEVPANPSLLSTETMWHLSTLIKGRLAAPQTSALELATLLHPTPAVCGYPTRQAHKLINLIESFDRGLFAGMVGWLDSEGNGEWVVTIRCGITHGNRIRLFAGAGIVEESCPESEWAETQAKLQTMLKALPFDVELSA